MLTLVFTTDYIITDFRLSNKMQPNAEIIVNIWFNTVFFQF